MNTLEIWTDSENKPSIMVEKWEMQPDGKAKNTFLKGDEVRYPYLGDVSPDQGEKYLRRLYNQVNNSSSIKAIIK